MHSSVRTYVVLLSGALLWCALIVVAPIFHSSGSRALIGIGDVLYGLFSPVCHQMDARSFHIFGAPLGVCARCSGIYFGFLIGAAFFPLIQDLRRPVQGGWRLGAVAAIPMLIDVCTELIRIHNPSTITRAITGGWFGLLMPFIVVPGVVIGVEELIAHH
jgi:uncharacterized membrane protein